MNASARQRAAATGGNRPAARAPRSPGEVRIIGGVYKRSKVPVPDAPGLRPTPDRVRETVFNWLGQTLAGLRVLDLYAGSGALALEAASRGATAVVAVEQQPRCAASIAATAQRLGASQVEVRSGDALQHTALLARQGARFDVVFIDPPYAADAQTAALAAAAAVLAPDGVVYLEAPDAAVFDAAAAAGWQVWRQARAGQVHYALLQRPAPPPA